MTFGAVASVVGIAGGINALTGGGITSALGFGESAPSGAQAQGMADPFAGYRSNLAAMYSGALQPGGPTNIQAMPGFTQFQTGVINPAMQASQRAAARTGMLYSGNEQMALQDVAQKGYYGFMTDYLNRLAQGSGAVNNPAQAAGLGLSQMGLNASGVMQGIGAVGQGLGKIFGGSGSTPDFGTGSGFAPSNVVVDPAAYAGSAGMAGFMG